MARTPLAARILIDPAFSDGYESNQSGEGGGLFLVEAEMQSPIDVEDTDAHQICGIGTEPAGEAPSS